MKRTLIRELLFYLAKQSVKEVVKKKNQQAYEHDANTIDDAWGRINEEGVAEEAWAEVAPNALEQGELPSNRPQTHERDNIESTELPDWDYGLPQQGFASRCIVSTEDVHASITKEEAQKYMRQMNA